nr:MAG TPA: hypothetical protein [Caudoviricetes sp.]
MHFSPVGESLLGSAFSSPRLTPGAFFIAVSRAPAKSDTRDGVSGEHNDGQGQARLPRVHQGLH